MLEILYCKLFCPWKINISLDSKICWKYFILQAISSLKKTISLDCKRLKYYTGSYFVPKNYYFSKALFNIFFFFSKALYGCNNLWLHETVNIKMSIIYLQLSRNYVSIFQGQKAGRKNSVWNSSEEALREWTVTLFRSTWRIPETEGRDENDDLWLCKKAKCFVHYWGILRPKAKGKNDLL